MTDLTKETVEQIEKLESMAVPAPWFAEPPGTSEPKSPSGVICEPTLDEDGWLDNDELLGVVYTGYNGKLVSAQGSEFPVGQHHINAMLIAELRTNAKALLRAWHRARELEAENARLRNRDLDAVMTAREKQGRRAALDEAIAAFDAQEWNFTTDEPVRFRELLLGLRDR